MSVATVTVRGRSWVQFDWWKHEFANLWLKTNSCCIRFRRGVHPPAWLSPHYTHLQWRWVLEHLIWSYFLWYCAQHRQGKRPRQNHFFHRDWSIEPNLWYSIAYQLSIIKDTTAYFSVKWPSNCRTHLWSYYVCRISQFPRIGIFFSHVHASRLAFTSPGAAVENEWWVLALFCSGAVWSNAGTHTLTGPRFKQQQRPQSYC